MHIAKLLTFSLALLHSASSFAAELSSDPVYWLEKMSTGVKQQNYAGTFTYLRGSTFDTVRIVHVYEDGQEIERLFNLNGDEREMFRQGDEAVAIIPPPAISQGTILTIIPFTWARFRQRFLIVSCRLRISIGFRFMAKTELQDVMSSKLQYHPETTIAMAIGSGSIKTPGFCCNLI